MEGWTIQHWAFLLLLIGFVIKVPSVPVHTWLPDAHVEAPTAGSVILAGVLLKMGTYGFMKLGFPLFPDATHAFTPVLMTLAVVSIVYGACLALVQTDIKKIIAYSSISHLGYVMLGLASLDLIGIQGAVIQMVSHGLTAAGLFMMIGMIYERCHTRELADYGGLASLLPVYSVFFAIMTLAAVGLPTTSGFTGEFLVLLGAFTSSVKSPLDRGYTLKTAIEHLRSRTKVPLLTGLPQMERMRKLVKGVGDDVEKGTATLLDGVEPHAYAHPFEPAQKKPKRAN